MSIKWKRFGRGCFVPPDKKGERPCDVDYKNVDTGEIRRFATTRKVSKQMPKTAESLEKLKRPGAVLMTYKPSDFKPLPRTQKKGHYRYTRDR